MKKYSVLYLVACLVLGLSIWVVHWDGAAHSGSGKAYEEAPVSPVQRSFLSNEVPTDAATPLTRVEVVAGSGEGPGSEDTPLNWKDLTDDPKALFRAMAPKSFDTSSLSDAELRDLAHYLGRAMIMTSSLMVEGEEPADALRRLPTGESVAQALGVTLTDEDRRAVERMAPIYRRRLDDLVPVAIADANALALAQYDRGEYSISMKSGGKLEEAPFTGDHPQGLHSWCTTVACMRTPYTISFEFDSGRYPGLESVFQQIADIKKEMRAEIVEHLQAW